MISKTALSSLLGTEVISIADSLHKSRIYYKTVNRSKAFDEQICYVNVHELVHRCKELALANNFNILERYNAVEAIGVKEQVGKNYCVSCYDDVPFNPSRVFKVYELLKNA